MLTKFNPFWPSRWPLTFSFFCFLWLLEKTGPVLGKAFSVAHKGPAFLLPRIDRGVSTCTEEQVTVDGLPPRASCWDVYSSTIPLPFQAFKPLKFRFSLWLQALNKLIYCCSTDCKISRFTVAKKEKEIKLRAFTSTLVRSQMHPRLPTKQPFKIFAATFGGWGESSQTMSETYSGKSSLQ